MNWFEVDRKGLGKLLERKGKEFVLFELVSNAWDEQTTEVRVSLERVPGTRKVKLVVTDDNPQGFAHLSHAFTLFAESAKKGDAAKRGRFNAGEKMVLALCESAEIATTTGTIVFDENGRHAKRAKTERGSVFTGVLRMTNEELLDCEAAMRRLIPNGDVKSFFNGELLPNRQKLASVDATLPTEIANAEGQLRPSQRKTRIDIYEPLEGETPFLYELGIPVVATSDRWHVDIQQKVPLGLDRDNVPPAYLARVRALTVQALSGQLTTEDANSTWVRDALQRNGDVLSDDTVVRLASLRFGDKRVAYDPSDLEANKLAVAQGYVVVHGGQLSRAEWDAMRRAQALPAAGKVTPSPRPYSKEGKPLDELAPEAWTPAMHAVSSYAQRIGLRLLGRDVTVSIVSDITWPFAATYGEGVLRFNLGRLGHRWFEGPLPPITELLLHEFGHDRCGDHLSSEYHDALTSLGAQLVQLALTEPALFELERDAPLA